mgnify:CR=1 FL=1|jgi:hypothetical protein
MSDDFSANPPCDMNVPSALVGMNPIKSTSMVCQGEIETKLTTGSAYPVSQNLMTFAESGARKTACSSLLYKPFQERNGKDGKL